MVIEWFLEFWPWYPTSRQEKGKEKNQECTSQLSQPHLFKAQRRLENVVFLMRKVWIQINDCFNKGKVDICVES